MTYFALGNTHHDLAVAKVGQEAAGLTRNAVGLSHVSKSLYFADPDGNRLEP